MGKMKLTKDNKRKKSASGVPNWLLTTIVVVILVAVLATCAATLVSNSGLVMRMSDAVKTDSYTVNGNMMSYYYLNTYSSFLDTYGSYASSLSLGENTPISEHRKIKVGSSTNDALFLGTTFTGSNMFGADLNGTWFDYFMSQTLDAVKTMLVYCEESEQRNITLTDAEKEEIDAMIEATILSYRLQYGVSEATALNAMYGSGVKKSDVRKAMELSTLATKVQESIEEEIKAATTDADISKKYEDNKKDYDLVDYFFYSYSVVYEDVAEELLGENYTKEALAKKKAEVDALYKKRVDEVKDHIAALEKFTTIEDFKKYVYTYVVEQAYTSIYDGQKISAEGSPSAEELATIKQKLIENAVAEALAKESAAKNDVVKTTTGEGESAVDSYTIYEISVKKEFADAAKKIKEELFSKANAVDKTYLIERATYTDTDTFIKWAYEADRKAGEIKNVAEGAELKVTDTGAIVKEVEATENGQTIKKEVELAETDRYLSKIYYVIKPQYQDAENTRDVAYMLFETESEAKKAIEKITALGSTLTPESFESVATQLSAPANTLIEDCKKGSMGSEKFDAWLYADTTTVGKYTDTPLALEESTYMVAYYTAEGEPSWKVTVKNDILTEKYTAKEDKMTTDHSAKLSVSSWTLARVGK